MALTNEVQVADVVYHFPTYDYEGMSAGESDTGPAAIKTHLDGAFNGIKLMIEERGLDPEAVPDDDSSRFKAAIIWLTLWRIHRHLQRELGGERYKDRVDEYRGYFRSSWTCVEVRQDTNDDGTADLSTQATQRGGLRLA